MLVSITIFTQSGFTGCSSFYMHPEKCDWHHKQLVIATTTGLIARFPHQCFKSLMRTYGLVNTRHGTLHHKHCSRTSPDDVTLFQRGNLEPFPWTSRRSFRSALSRIRHGVREKLQLQIINYHISTGERTASSYSRIITASFCITCHVWSWLHAEVLRCIMFFCHVFYFLPLCHR